jgi:CheY-like chemotaxis protein
MGKRNGKPAIILLAEDDPGDQELTRRALQEDVLDTDLHVVSNGEAAMDYLLHRGRYSDPAEAPHPDLVLLDLNLPRLDGRQVLEQMRSHPDLRRIPVVVLTTSKQEEDILRSYDLGCNSFITKPVDVEGFVQCIRGLGMYWFELVALPSQ